MRMRRVKASAGKPDELASRAIGYASNGMSIHSRRAAAGAKVPLGVATREPVKAHVFLLVPELIEKTNKELSKLQRKLADETAPGSRAKIERNIGIKVKFLVRLYEQQMGARHGTA